MRYSRTIKRDNHGRTATPYGLIALAGFSGEFGVIMLLYLKHAWEAQLAAGESGEVVLVNAIREVPSCACGRRR